VLIGCVSEDAGWEVIRNRLRMSTGVLADLRGDLAARKRWYEALWPGCVGSAATRESRW
jgi:hypothetical protein